MSGSPKHGPKMQCPECGQVLQSMHRHDFVRCGCPNECFVDGGGAYLRMGWRNRAPKPVIDSTPKQ
jgi:hypothetical protein